MAIFCGNCGSPLATNSAFCPNCGQRSSNPPPNPAAAAPVPGYSNPPPQTSKGSSALKIVLVVVCVLAVVGVSIVGGMVYLAHRVKQAIVQKAEESGVDLHALGNGSSSDAGRH